MPVPSRPLQPLLHDAVVCVKAPKLAISRGDAQIRSGVDGIYDADRRLLSRLVLRISGAEPEPILGQLVAGPAEGRFVGLARNLGPAGNADPKVIVERRRFAEDRFETVRVLNASRQRIDFEVEIELGTDLADMTVVKSGQAGAELVPARLASGLEWTDTGFGVCVQVRSDPAPDSVRLDGLLRWAVGLEPAQTWSASLTTAVTEPVTEFVQRRAPAGVPWSVPQISCADRRLPDLVSQSLADLHGLLLCDPEAPEDVFLAAGSPWFLTLFGRDALWAARMLLPLGTELAAGTLRTLARRQGATVDEEREEQPGKILHELRRNPITVSDTVSLPARYYGTIDATPLFVTLLGEAWRWGMAEAEVAALMPAAESALGWLRTFGDPDGDGFLEYVASRNSGLSNQGWKDSDDSIQFADGRLARSPIALCEVQGYAYEAAHHGAALLDAFGRPGADEWRDWAAHLDQRFRSAFWVEDEHGPYVALALDADKRPVDGVASNMGHLLGTGLLSVEESAHVARRLASPELDSGWGLRTLSSHSRGFSPLSYHGGAVWPHDTAIAAAGLARSGFAQPAVSLLRGIVEAAPSFDYRLPELHGGEQRAAGLEPLPYPASCRPQAWAAAASVLVLQALLGLDVDVPAGRLSLRPLHPSPYPSLQVTGLRAAGAPLSVRVRADGAGEVLAAAAGLTIEAHVSVRGAPGAGRTTKPR